MKNRFQLGFLLGSLIPLAAICALGHSPRVCLAAGAGFAALPALLWPRRVSRWLSGLGEFYERATSRPARSGRPSTSGFRSSNEVAKQEVSPSNASPTPESARRRQNVVSALRNFGCPKPKAVAIATAVADISDEKEQLYAAMRMVRA